MMSEIGLHITEAFLYRIDVRAIRWQEQQYDSSIFNQFFDLGNMVDSAVIHDND